MGIKNNKLNETENKRRKVGLQKKYATRITIARQAREHFLANEYVPAAKKYSEYLQVLSETHDLEDIYALRPEHFGKKIPVTELLLISHVFWELARTYEMVPKFASTFNKCMDQFIRFTINQPYQVLNAEMLRKYINKNKKRSIQIDKLNESYTKIFIQSKKCYIATMCFGENHPTTQNLRLFKHFLLEHNIGQNLVKYYYRYSPFVVSYLEQRPFLAYISKIIVVPFLKILAFLTYKLYK